MKRFIAEMNIAHFRRLLTNDLTPDERASLEELLAEEEAKLRELKAASENERCRA